ncbi:MAG: Hsp20/alpha crystallin family protein [Gaiellaceae bacterium]|jgi:HSP20 family molecular chaperone IbpA
MSERKSKGPRSEEIDQFDQLLTDLWRAQFGGRHGFWPAVDSYRTEEPPRLVVIVELPGIDPEQIQIVLHDGALIIAGERIRPKTCGRRYHQMEIDHGPFERRIQLHEQVDAEGAGASYERGLLEIVLPIAKRPTGPVRVPIELRSKP